MTFINVKPDNSGRTARLQGEYLDDFVDSILAGFLGAFNVLILTPPGWGKTRVSIGVADALVGRDSLNITRLGKGSRPSQVEGTLHPDTFKGGERKMNLAGTAMDDKYHMVLFDEIGRANDVVLDAALVATDRIDLPPMDRAMFVATANQFDLREYTQAVADRFAAWVHLKPNMTDRMFGDIMQAQLTNGQIELALPNSIISFEDAMAIRNSLPTERTVEAIIKKGLGFKLASQAAGFQVNPRRVDQWRRLMYYFSAYKWNTNDFDRVHPDALNLMRYMQPCASLEEHEAWVNAISDQINAVQTMIEGMYAQIIKSMKRMAEQAKVEGRDAILAEMLTFQQTATADLRQAKTDMLDQGEDVGDEVDRAIDNVLRLSAAITQGQNVDFEEFEK